MKRLIILAAAGGLLGLQGCAVEEDGTDTVGTTSQQTACGTSDAGVNETKAALAVAMAEELGELDPVRQLEVVGGKLQLKAGVCPDECPKTEALLDFQDDFWRDVIDQNTFNPTVYRETLVASLDRQRNHEIDLLNNNPTAIPAEHSLHLAETRDNACGVDFIFDVTAPDCTSAGTTTQTVSVPGAPIYEIKGVDSNKCLDIAGGSTANGANAQQYSCWRGAPQQFALEDAGDGYVMIKNVNSGKCLDVAGWSTNDGANLQQWECHYGANQQFQVVDAGNGKKGLINRHSGKAVEVGGWSKNDGANVSQWTYYSTNNNKVWYLNQIGQMPSSTETVVTGTSSSCDYDANPALLENRLVMFGGDSNPYLRFSSTATTISIDPDFGDTGVVSTSDNTATCDATSLCRVYDPMRLRDGCCTCDTVANGVWDRFLRNPAYAICKPQ